MKILHLLAALYGLFQAAYEFYILIMSLFLDLGMSCCNVDHGVFIGEWLSPPDPTIAMPSSSPLLLYVPIHVDDGLGIMNSHSLYLWFLSVLSKHLHIVDLGPCSKFLSILIIHDCPHHQLWLPSHIYVSELLDEWYLSSCKTATTPFPSGFPSISDAQHGTALLDISDADLIPRYQHLVCCLLYLVITTHLDLLLCHVAWSVQCITYSGTLLGGQACPSLLGQYKIACTLSWHLLSTCPHYPQCLHAECWVYRC